MEYDNARESAKKKTSRWEFRLLGFCPFGLLFALCVTLSLLGEQLLSLAAPFSLEPEDKFSYVGKVLQCIPGIMKSTEHENDVLASAVHWHCAAIV